MKFPLQVLVMLLPLQSFAEDLCESRESIRSRVKYCHENLEYVAPAEACSAEYKNLVSSEQKRLKSILDAKLKAAPGSAQNVDFQTSDQVLKSALEDLTYLIDYGKQVHTEIEDYVYATVPPIYDEADAKADINDPDVMDRFKESECFGPPIAEMETLELGLRPIIEDLENTKAQVESLIQETNESEAHLNSLNQKTSSAMKTSLKSKVHARSASTITGNIDLKKLSSTEVAQGLRPKKLGLSQTHRSPAAGSGFVIGGTDSVKSFLSSGQLEPAATAQPAAYKTADIASSQEFQATDMLKQAQVAENPVARRDGGLVGALIVQARGLQGAATNGNEAIESSPFSSAVTGEITSGSMSMQDSISHSLFDRVHSIMRSPQRMSVNP